MMIVIQKAWIYYFLQIVFLVYYRLILGYVLTIFLRIGLRFGLVKIVKKKKRLEKLRRRQQRQQQKQRYRQRQQQQEEDEEEWKIKTNFRSLFSVKKLSSFIRCNYYSTRRGHNQNQGQSQGQVNDNDNDDNLGAETNANEIIIKPKHISIMAAIPSCRITTMRLSTFMPLQGKSKCRTYFLGIMLEKILFQLDISIRIENIDTDVDADIDSSDGGGSTNADTHVDGSDNGNDDETKQTDLKIKINLVVGMIKVYLFSQGLIAVLLRNILKLFRKVQHYFNDDDDIDHDNIDNGHNDGDDDNNDIDSARENYQKNPLYIITKIIGGIDLMNIHVGLSISTLQNQDLNYNYNATLDVKEIVIKLENKNADTINDNHNDGNLNAHDSANSNNGVNDNINASASVKRNFYLSVELSSLKANITNGMADNTKTELVSIEQVSFSYILSDISTAQIEINTNSVIEISLLSTEIINLMTMIFKLIQPTINEIAKIGTRADGSRSKNQNPKNGSTLTLIKISINLGLKLVLIDDTVIRPAYDTRMELGLKKICFELEETENSGLSSIGAQENKTSSFHPAKDLSVSVENLYFNHCANEDNKIGTFKFNMNEGSLMIEKDLENEGNDIFIDIDLLTICCDNARESEYIIKLGMYFLHSLDPLFPKKKKKQMKENKNLRDGLAISCKALKLGINIPCREKPENEFGLRTDAQVEGFLLSITPPDSTRDAQEIEDGEIRVEVGNVCTSLCFVPHQTLPSFGECVNKVTSLMPVSHDMTQDRFKSQEKKIKYVLSGSKFKLQILGYSGKQPYFDISMSETILNEELSLAPYHESQTHYLVRYSETIQFILEKSISMGRNDDQHFVQNIQIYTEGKVLAVHWSPITQWFITSGVQKIVNVVQYYLGLIKKGVTKPMPKKEEIPTNVMIASNDTVIEATAILGGTSICSVVVKELAVMVSHNVDDTWEKPDVTCEIGEISVNLNHSDFEVVKTTSFRFRDTLRRASTQEISAYCNKKRNDTFQGFDEIVTGTCGTPLVERFELSFGTSTKVDLPPLLHLGKFIEDITLTERSVREGLFVSNIVKRKPPTTRKYQLMDIHFNVPMLDANFFEAKSSNNFKHFPGVKFGNGAYKSVLNRWRFHIRDMCVLIKRNTPPDIIQEQISGLDEDKSRKYKYGPVIQGGDFDLNISHVSCVLHPLNMASPLGDIKNLKIVGLIYLAALSPDTKGLDNNAEKICVPVKGHHSLPNYGCDYGVILESCLAPVKIYHNVEISSTEVHSNFGPVLNASMPGLMHIIQRLIPTRPYIDERFKPGNDIAPPLSPWDNMRHQFHGKFSWTMEKVSFRWLLDTVPKYDWSILLTTKDLYLDHSVGIFDLKISDVIVSIPHSSYHLLHFEDGRNSSYDLQERMKVTHRDEKFKRHSLLLIPFLKIHFGFGWQVPFPEVNESTRHHIPYLVEVDSWPQSLCPEDKFKYFRSEGINMHLQIELRQTSQFSNWVALRADVLPWITHKCSSLPDNSERQDTEDDHEFKINGIQIDVDVTEMHIGAWFDERADFMFDENNSGNDILEGIYITMPHVRYTLDSLGRNRIDLDGVQAALLDIDYSTFGCPTGRHRLRQHCTMTEWTGILNQCDHKELNDVNSFRTFESLYTASKQIKILDYLLTIDQINILDKSLDEILSSSHELDGSLHAVSEQPLSKVTNSCHDMGGGFHSINDKNIQAQKAPWTVLVAHMKLLWTVAIRDRVLSIVKDILFAINFMKVNARGTPQQLVEKVDPEISHSICLEEGLNQIEISVASAAGGNEASSHIFEDTAIETSPTKTGVQVNVTTLHGDKSADVVKTARNKPKSSLEYLLLDPNKKDESHLTSGAVENNDIEKTARLTTMKFESNIENLPTITETYSNEREDNDTIPTFDLHLSNPQIQFHSEKTGGSVIIAMRGAYIEMKMYSHLFCKEEDLEIRDLSVETLLRRTEFLYTLDRMELYSLSNMVDLDAGLQWLGTERMNNENNREYNDNDDDVSDRTQQLQRFLLNNIDTRTETKALQNISSDVRDEWISNRNKKLFPPDLQKHETKMFTLPSLCQKIMDPCTFTTLQTFHRPPIDLTKEELAETIEEGLILSLTTTGINDVKSSRAIDHIELFIDELSFLLDSHQFSTTFDVIRNVLLEPLKPNRERYYKANQENEQDGKEQQVNSNSTRKNDGENSEAFEKMEEAIRQWDHQAYQKTKKGREYLRSIANDLLKEVEEKQGGAEPSIRRIEYTLCKAKWKIASPDAINDSEISFTGFKGVHDFTADGSVNSQVTLEDINVVSIIPGNESMDFDDPTIIIKTVTGVERSPCCRCGKPFDRSTNESNSCKYHTGSFKMRPGEKIRSWTCCKALWEKAPGCKAQPHTGIERAVAVRMDAFPRTVEGLTMYKHIEANIYPSVPHTIIVQLTKSLTKSFSNYFLGDGTKDEIIGVKEPDPKSETSTPKQLRRRCPSDSSSDTHDGSMKSELMNTSFSSLSSKGSLTSRSSRSDSQDKGRKGVLFGIMHNKRRKESLNKKKKEQIAIVPEAPTELKSKPKQISTDITKEEAAKKAGEIVFVKYWRVGNININLSIAGFGRIVNLSNQSVVVPFFKKAYKIGASQHLINKVIKHFGTSLVHNGFDIIRNKIGGKHQRPYGDGLHLAFSSGALDNLEEESESDDNEGDDARAMMLLPASAIGKKKRKPSGNMRNRLYTR